MPWKRLALVAVALVVVLGVAYSFLDRPQAVGQTVEVYKSPT